MITPHEQDTTELADALSGLRQRYAERHRMPPWDVEWLELRIAAIEHQLANANAARPSGLRPTTAGSDGSAPSQRRRIRAR